MLRSLLNRPPSAEDTADELARLRREVAELRARELAAPVAGPTETRLQLALRIAPVAVFTHGADLRYSWVYSGLGNGAAPSRLLGITDLEISDDPSWAAVHAFKQGILESGRGDRRTFRVVMPRDGLHAGEVRHYDLLVEPQRDADGAITGLSGVALDVTAEMERQEQLEAAKAEAERANRAKSRFLAAASHDLRQPFQAMRLFLHLLEARLTDKGQQELAGKLEEALTASESLLTTLLDISALEAATVTPNPTRFPIGEVLRRLGEQFGPEAAAKGLELRVVPSSLEVRSDPVLLDRMLRNLVVNALRYTSTGRILLGCRRRGGQVIVQVLDTGQGIPADKQRQIFDEFVRLSDQPQTKGQQGLGLGLAIVRRTGQLLGHPIDVRSEPGRGSVFSVAVPVDAVVAAPVAPAAAPEPMHARTLVAVLEDDPLQLTALEHMLQDWGCSVIASGRPEELMTLIRAEGRAPDLIASDYRLPGGVSGMDVIRRVREEWGAEVAGLLITGDTHQDLQEEVAREGFAIVHKPIHPLKLRRTIESAVAKAG
ncbi:MAG TPA: ATP-binding protein [Azospirillaceae bacterium]|nr:ATP-binding protein [Azospirillaceae bacterium]